MFREFVYAPNEFQNHMFTKLYLGEHADSYAQYGLCDADWCKDPSKRLKNWKFVREDNFGYTRIWKLAMQCEKDSDCSSSSQYCDETKHCVDKKKEGETCTNNTECASGICENNICRNEPLKAVGEKCSENNECKSNVCEGGTCKEFSSNISEEVKKFESKNAIIPACMKEVIPEKDKPKFYNCYINKEKEGVVNAQYALGAKLGVGGTPSFVTGCDKNEMEDLCNKISEKNRGECRLRLVQYINQNKDLQCKKDGKILIYEFTDLMCPFCYRAEPFVDELLNLSNVDLEINFFKIHGDPVHKEHIATMCAADVGKFREFETCAFDKHFKEGMNEAD